MSALELFHPATRAWFKTTLGQPSPPQEEAWPLIARGDNVLVCAPTGTGKTLCAFMAGVDALVRSAVAGELNAGVQILYISPLKALGNDIAVNLERPLSGISIELDKMGLPHTPITRAVRTGDTPQYERARILRTPPHILITTPESLYLYLSTTNGMNLLSGVKTVIIDELHALMENKRGTHLSVSLERLAKLTAFQRVGLSATIKPLSSAASFLGGHEKGSPRAVRVVKPDMKKTIDVTIESCAPEDGREESIYQGLFTRVRELALSSQRVMVFCQNRMVAERVAAGVNLEHGGALCRTHHGAMSREMRHDVEHQLREGSLRCLIATSSMELGIDVGEIDLIIQIGSPQSVSRALQRIGRAGHRLGAVSRMIILPMHDADILESAFISRAMADVDVEPMATPRDALDVLAQHLVSMASAREWGVDEAFETVRGADGYKNLSREEFDQVLRMLRGDFERGDAPARPRILWDESRGTIRADGYGRMLSLSSGGTIPDRGYYGVYLTDNTTKLGEVDEIFVFESRMGDRFMLGSFCWRIVRFTRDRLYVEPAVGQARTSFWMGDPIGRAPTLGERMGAEWREIERSAEEGRIRQLLRERYPVNEVAIDRVGALIEKQLQATGCLYSDKSLLVEQYADENGLSQWVLHCPLGLKVNGALAALLQQIACEALSRSIQAYANDDGVLLASDGTAPFPRGMLKMLDPACVRRNLAACLPSQPSFSIAFRNAAARALLTGMKKLGQRSPLWLQRIKAAELLESASHRDDHPIILEAYRECMERVYDVDRAKRLLEDIASGEAQVIERHTPEASALTKALRYKHMGVMMYEDQVPRGVLEKGALIDDKWLTPPEQDAGPPELSERPAPVPPMNAEALMLAILRDGGWPRAETVACGQADHARSLVAEGRAVWIDDRLFASNEAGDFARWARGDISALGRLAGRRLFSRGPMSSRALAEGFGVSTQAIGESLDAHLNEGRAVAVLVGGEPGYAHRRDAEKSMRSQAFERRAEVTTQPAAHYAAFLPQFQTPPGGSGEDTLRFVLAQHQRVFLPLDVWLEVIFPSRVTAFKPAKLDGALKAGEWTYRCQNGDVAFYPSDAVSEEYVVLPELAGDAKEVGNVLAARGAVFASSISQACGFGGVRLSAALRDLVERGLALNDSFEPVLMWSAEKDRADIRSSTRLLTAGGRWELARKIRPAPPAEQLALLLERWGIVSRASALADGVTWDSLDAVLTARELQGTLRRGYYTEGMPGAQFVRADVHERVTRALSFPDDDVRCLCAADPALAYGRVLDWPVDRQVMRLASNAVVLYRGDVVMTLTRGGQIISFFGEPGLWPDAARAFVSAFEDKRVWPGKRRVTSAEVAPAEGIEVLIEAGFFKEAQNLVKERTRW